MAIFVGGTGRSGTHALAGRLAALPGVVYLDETRFLSDPGGLGDLLKGKIAYSAFRRKMRKHFRGRFIARLERAGHGALPLRSLFSARALDVDLAATLEQEQTPEKARAFVDRVYGRVVEAAGGKTWLEKTPHNVRYAALLAGLFPAMRMVHLIRDPADVCASMLTKDWGPRRVDRFPAYYLRVMRAAWGARERTPPECYLVESLETMVASPRERLARVCDFLGVEPPAGWLETQAAAITPARAHIGRAQDELSAKDRAFIAARCGEIYRRWLDLA